MSDDDAHGRRDGLRLALAINSIPFVTLQEARQPRNMLPQQGRRRVSTAEILSHVASALVGAITGSFLTFKYTRSNAASGHGRVVDQSGSHVSGDQTGGNKTQR